MFVALVAGRCICCLAVAIVNKREGRTEFIANSEILYLDFSVDIARTFSASLLCKAARGRLYTVYMCWWSVDTFSTVRGKTNKNNLYKCLCPAVGP